MQTNDCEDSIWYSFDACILFFGILGAIIARYGALLGDLDSGILGDVGMISGLAFGSVIWILLPVLGNWSHFLGL